MDGRTPGIFFDPGDAKKIYSGFPYLAYARKFRKGALPHWAREDKVAKDLIKRYIFWEKIWVIVVIAAIVTIMFSS